MADLTVKPKQIDAGNKAVFGEKSPVDFRQLVADMMAFASKTPPRDSLEWSLDKLKPLGEPKDVEGLPGLKDQYYDTTSFAPDARIRIRFREGADDRAVLQMKPSGAKVDVRTDKPSPETLAVLERVLGKIT
jgi:hypothetical protein